MQFQSAAWMMAAAGVVGMSGAAFAGPGAATQTAPDAWLYPRATFEDGRTREASGEVSFGLDGRFTMGDPDDRGPRAVCFSEGYNPSKAEWDLIMGALQDGYQSRYNIGNRWNSANGDPVNLTWSFAMDNTQAPNLNDVLGPSVLFSTLDASFASAGGRATWIARFQSVFDRWQALTGVNYTRVRWNGNDWDDGAAWGNGGQANTRGDIRIAMRPIDGQNGVLAFNSFPTGGDMVLDANETWSAANSTHIFLRNVVAHEHGHGLGLPHVCPISQTKLLEPFYSGNFDGPRLDDVRGIQHMYGDPDENNDSVSTAFDLGTLGNGSVTNRGTVPNPAITGGSLISLNPTNDQDWYKFTLNSAQLVNFTITPVGTGAYLDLDQNGDGSCPTSGTTTDPLRQADIQLQVYNSTGASNYITLNAGAVGVAETLNAFFLPQGLTTFKVTGAVSFSQSQMYTMSINVGNVNWAPSASDSTFADKVRITWPAVTNASGYQVRRNTVDVQSSATSIGTVAAGITTFDDTVATAGTTYYYWVYVAQTASSVYRAMNLAGEQGRRATNQNPVANAGSDQTVTDTDSSGGESVSLNGSASTDDGTIVNYLWQEGATTLANGASPTPAVVFPLGVHTVTLTVTDNFGATASDTVVITVNPPSAACDPDMNQDGNVDQDDVAYLINVIAGGPNPAGTDPDFNHDGNVDQDDYLSLVNVVGGGPCPP